MRSPNFENFLKVLRREKPDRPTLFEFFLNFGLYDRLALPFRREHDDPLGFFKTIIHAYRNTGHDYATIPGIGFRFPLGKHTAARSISLNEGALISDRASFETYAWPDPDAGDYSAIDKAAEFLPDGMKFVICGPGGVVENVVYLVGYENLCLMTREDPDLVNDLFAAVGSRLARYYELVSPYASIGALIANDDWGFAQQTIFPPDEMRQCVIPWHKKIVENIHAAGKPAILHSCGNLEMVMDDIIDTIGYDAKHSFQDCIQPVEEAYEQYHDRIAILGGMDVDFLCRSSIADIKKRSLAMVERVADRGGYALGSGNSIPEYVPDEAYLAMITVANEIE